MTLDSDHPRRPHRSTGPSPWRSPLFVLALGCAIVGVGFSISYVTTSSTDLVFSYRYCREYRLSMASLHLAFIAFALYMVDLTVRRHASGDMRLPTRTLFGVVTLLVASALGLGATLVLQLIEASKDEPHAPGRGPDVYCFVCYVAATMLFGLAAGLIRKKGVSQRKP